MCVLCQALQSRLKYLNTHTIKLQPEEEDKEKEGEAAGEAAPAEAELAPPQTPLSVVDPGAAALDTEVVLTLEPPPAPTPREMLQPLDITPFVRYISCPHHIDTQFWVRVMSASESDVCLDVDHVLQKRLTERTFQNLPC